MARLSLSQIQRLKNDKQLRVEDVIKQPPDYTSTSQRIKLFICGILMLFCTIIFATFTLYSICSKIFDPYQFSKIIMTNYELLLIFLLMIGIIAC